MSLRRAALVTALVAAGCGGTSDFDLSKLDGGPAGHAVGGTVQGLTGQGLVLRNLGADDLAVAADGHFAFATRLQPGASFLVTVAAQPHAPDQTCLVSGGSGLMGSVDIIDVLVRCTTHPPVTVAGVITGLTSDGLILENDSGDDLTLPAGSTNFAFATQVPQGDPLAITVKRQPRTPVLQTCTITNANAAAGDAKNPPSIACSDNPLVTLSGAVSGLVGAGLVLKGPGGELKSVPPGSTRYQFDNKLQTGASYAITVQTQPSNPLQVCTVASASGVVAGPVSADVTCGAAPSHKLGGMVNGLAGTGLVLLNGSDATTPALDGSFTFPTPIQAGASYAISVQAQPVHPNETCTVDTPTGTMPNADYAGLSVTCTLDPYFNVGGNINGLAGNGLTLHNAANLDDTLITGNGPFDMNLGQQQGDTFTISVVGQPVNPLQTCAVEPATATGSVGDADVTSIAVDCTTNPYYNLGGSVSGLVGHGLVLHDDRGGDLPVQSNGAFVFSQGLQGTQGYTVSVAAQPFGPSQSCTVANATGVVQASDVNTLQVSCTLLPSFRVVASVSGLHGSGLVLQNDGADDLPISADGQTAFASQLQQNAPYIVTVKAQPGAPFQTCSVTNGSGIIGNADASVTISCSDNPSFSIGGNVSGLTNSGLVLRLNGANDLAVSTSGGFKFGASLQQGTAYTASVAAQPAGQTCAVTSGGAGIVGAANVTGIGVTCGAASYFRVLAQVSGTAGTGLVLRHDGTDDLPISADGTFAFADQQLAGQSYSVSVASQPSGPAQTCALGANATGTLGSADVTVAVTCTTNPFFHVTGVVNGLTGSGLVLSDNGGDQLPVSANGSFAFAGALQAGQQFSVAVAQQPSGPEQTCTVQGGSGLVGASDVTNILVSCTTNPFFLVAGVVRGLAGSGLVLQDDLAGDVPVAADGTFIFLNLLQAGSSYSVTVKSQPTLPAQTCTVSNGSGVVTRTVTNISVTCAPTVATFTLGVNVTGLLGSGFVLSDNATDLLTVTANGTSTFAVPLATGALYAVAVKTAPTSPAQTCRIYNPVGLMGAANTVLGVVCTATAFTVGGSVTGLPAGATVTLQDNGFDNKTVTGSGTGATAVTFAFGVGLGTGKAYSAVLTGATGPVQCALSSGATGTVGNANVTSILVACQPAFTISGTVAGLAGTGLSLTNTTTGETLALAKTATTFAFTKAVSTAQGYSLSVASQPASPTQSCSVTANGSGNPTANVTTAAVTCATTAFTVGGNVAGLPAGGSVTLTDNGGDSTGAITANGPFTFATSVASGAAYAAAVSATSGAACTVANGSGTVGAANVGNIAVNCAPTFHVSGAIAGLSAAGLTLKNTTTGETQSMASGATSFAFNTPVTQAQGYKIVASAQPTGLVCGATGGQPSPAGNPTADVTNLSFTCSATSFTVGGSVSGLPSGASVTLANINGDSKTVSANGAYTFASAIAGGDIYSVSVSSATNASCTVANASGTVGSANVTSVNVSCVAAFSISGTLATYAGSGLSITNSATAEVVSPAKGATTFAFTKQVTQAQGYALSVTAQPASPTQSCALTANGSGNPTANVTNAAVTCTTTGFSVGGSVTGLPAGASVTLLDNGADALTVNGAGDGSAPVAFTFATAVKSGAAYATTISASTGVACTVASGSGTVGAANVANVAVSCAPGFHVSGTITGYTGTGLKLANGALETITIAPGATSFAFTRLVSHAAGYAISVNTQPSAPSQTCSVAADSPALATGFPTADVTNVSVVCLVNTFTVGGTVTGLTTGNSLTLRNNGADAKTVAGTAGGTVNFTFPTALPPGSAYSASIASIAFGSAGVSCSITSGASGTIAAANVSNIALACSPVWSIGGTVTGYLGSGLQLLDSTTGELFAVAPGSAAFTMNTRVSTAQGYAVSIAQQPVNPSQSCALSGPATGNPSANVTSLALNCAMSAFTVGGVVNGLTTGTSLLLENDGGDDLRLSAGSPSYPFFTFATPVQSGASYTVTVRQQPPGQLCAPRGTTGAGMVGSSAVTSVIIDCAPTHALSGKVTGYLGGGLQISDGIDTLPIASSGGADVAFKFPTPVAAGANFVLSVAGSPANPAQTCTPSGGSLGGGAGAMPNADESDLVLACGTPAWKVSGTVLGLSNGAGGAIVIANGGDSTVLSFSSTATSSAVPFQMPQPVTQGQPYAVTVASPPSGLACIVRNGSGTVGAGDVTTVQIVCGFAVAGTFDTTTVSGVTGQLPGVGLKLADTTAFGSYTDSETLTVPTGAASFAFNDPAPRGGSCTLALSAQPVAPGEICTVTAASGCTGAAITGPLAAVVRCVEQVELFAFPGAAGSMLAIDNDPLFDVVAGGNFSGSADFGHGARAASTFSSVGSGLAAGFDPNGQRGAAASPASASWDRLFPNPAATAPNAGAARVRAIAVNAAGEIYAAGSFTGTVDFGDGTAPTTAASESMFLARLDGTGAPVWVQRFGPGAIASLAVKGTRLLAGGVYASAAAGKETFGGATCSLTASSAHHDFVASFDTAAGACAFAVDLAAGADPASTTPRLGPAVAFDSVGSAIAAGNAADATGLTALAGPYIATLDANGQNACTAGSTGNELFTDTTTPTKDAMTGVAVTSSDAIVVAGYCQGSPKVKGAAVTCGSTATSAAFAKYLARASCASGKLVGAGTSGAVTTVIGSGGSSKVSALASDASGNLLAVGNYSGTPSIAGVALFAGSSTEAQNAYLAVFPPALTAPVVEAVNATGAIALPAVAPGALHSTWAAGAYSGTVTYRGRSPALGTSAANNEPLLLRFPQGPP